MRFWRVKRASDTIPDILAPFQIVTSGKKTPVVLVSSKVRVERDDKLPPGMAYFVDGETFMVNGEYPYSAKGAA